jgi:hypothetical protein
MYIYVHALILLKVPIPFGVNGQLTTGIGPFIVFNKFFTMLVDFLNSGGKNGLSTILASVNWISTNFIKLMPFQPSM